MIIELTKKFVVDSLVREKNIQSGFSWIMERPGLSGLSSKDCPACAVGAVMRAAMSDDARVYDIFYACDNATSAEKTAAESDGVDAVICMPYCDRSRSEAEVFRAGAKTVRDQPWRTLSFVFESLVQLDGKSVATRTSWDNAVIKSKVLRFVRAFFPETALADINGYSPAKDIRVVKP